jgi:predicted DNA-binding protein (UPF0251 family)
MKLCVCGCGESFDSNGPQRAIFGHPVGHCSQCEIPLVSDSVWEAYGRAGKDRSHFARHSGNKLCNGCFKRISRAEYRRRENKPAYSGMRRREEVLEDWELLRSDGVTDLEVAAHRMGMSKGALEQALYRARKAGDSRGIVHRNDQLGGGIRQGRTGATRTAA